MSYKEDLEVDKYSLDICWENQSSLFIKYADISIDCNIEKDHAEIVVEKLESELKETLAYLTLEVKNNFKTYNFEKAPSDTTSASWAILQKEYKDKRDELFKAKEELNDKRNQAYRIRNAVSAFADRKMSLQNLQTLYLNGYYSDNRGNEDFNTKMNKRRE